MIDKRTAAMLGLCRRAGKLVSGEAACVAALQSGEAALVITAADASANTRKRFSQKAFYYGVPFCGLFAMDELNAAAGLSGKATVVVTDGGFAGQLIKLIGTEKMEVEYVKETRA